MSALLVGVTMSEGSKQSDARLPSSCGLAMSMSMSVSEQHVLMRSRMHAGGGAKDVAGTFDCRALCPSSPVIKANRFDTPIFLIDLLTTFLNSVFPT